MFAVDSSVNAVCIYLSFSMAQNHYRFLCSFMNKLCIKCCKCMANIRVACSKDVEREFEISTKQSCRVKVNENSSQMSQWTPCEESQRYQNALRTSDVFKVNENDIIN
eukprot:UN04997